MGFFSDWFSKPERPKVSDLEKDAIDGLDRFDREDFAAIDKQMKEFRLARHEVEDFADTGHELWSDSYFGLLKADPRVKDASRMRPTYLINQIVATEIAALPEKERLRTWSVGDPVAAAMGTTTLKDDVITLYDRAKKRRQEDEGGSGKGNAPGTEIEKGLEEWDFAEQGVRDMEDMIEAWKNLPENDPQANPEALAQGARMDELAKQARFDLQQMQEGLEGDLEKLKEDLTGIVHGCMPAIRKDLADQADANEELAALAAGWGVEPGEIQKMDFAQRAALAVKLGDNPKIKALSEILGAMQRTALECQTRKVYHSFEEVYDVSVGSDLNRLLPEELIGLADPLLEMDFMQRYTEDKLLQYEMRGNEKMAKGGIVFAMDNSGSMKGDPEIWAKAVGLAVLSIAREQKRAFYGIHFSSRGQLNCFDFRKTEDIVLDKVLEYAEHFWNGGTDFESPLTHALGILQEEFDKDGAVKGDIIFVTDGICGLSPAFMANFKTEQERLGFSVYGLMIGGNRMSEPLWTLCDHQVVTITDLLTGGDVTDLFRAL